MEYVGSFLFVLLHSKLPSLIVQFLPENLHVLLPLLGNNYYIIITLYLSLLPPTPPPSSPSERVNVLQSGAFHINSQSQSILSELLTLQDPAIKAIFDNGTVHHYIILIRLFPTKTTSATQRFVLVVRTRV